MLFKKEDLIDLTCSSSILVDGDKLELVEDRLVDSSRWSLHYSLIFRYRDKFYATSYSRGATEMQDESPFDDYDDEIECLEVVPVEVTKIEYRPV